MPSNSGPSATAGEVLPTFRARETEAAYHDPIPQELVTYPGYIDGSNNGKNFDLTDAQDGVVQMCAESETGRRAHAEARPFHHKYFFRRPRLLQYYDHGELVDSYGHRASVDVHEHLIDDTSGDPKIQRDFLNLFIDLLWAGIIGNISENFVGTAFDPEESWGLAFLEFSILFLTATKMWNYLRRFLNSFFNKDWLQAMFIIWILVVALYFGNQAPRFEEPGGPRTIIWTYLTAKFSFIAVELFYSIFISQIRQQLFVAALMALPISGLWIGALRVPWPAEAALILPALFLEGLAAAVMELPVGDWFLAGAPKKALDPDNFVERLQSFFIIILGEGVFTLINGNSAPRVTLGVAALLIYYVLFSLYFSGDLTKTYIHAVFRNRYTAIAFQSIHVMLYASLLLLDSSVRFVLSLDASQQAATDDPDPEVLQKWARSLYRARFTVSSALSTVIICMTVKALLNRSLDKPKTLLVSNRYIRMAPRGLAIIAVMCLTIITKMGIGAFMGAVLGILLPLILWEYIAAMEYGSRLIEPKESEY